MVNIKSLWLEHVSIGSGGFSKKVGLTGMRSPLVGGVVREDING